LLIRLDKRLNLNWNGLSVYWTGMFYIVYPITLLTSRTTLSPWNKSNLWPRHSIIPSEYFTQETHNLRSWEHPLNRFGHFSPPMGWPPKNPPEEGRWSRALSSQYHDSMGCLGGGAGRNSTYPILQFYSICLHRQFGRVSWRLEWGADVLRIRSPETETGQSSWKFFRHPTI